MNEVIQRRSAIIAALPPETANFGETPEAGRVYVPPAHKKALHFHSSVVVGSRGVGKSFWTAALRDQRIRSVLATSIPELEATDVHGGFGLKPDISAYPDRDVFAELIKNGHSPYQIWRAVLARGLSKFLDRPIRSGSWLETTAWVGSNAEQLSHLLRETSERLSKENRRWMIVFDALDRCANDWHGIDAIVRGLLQVILELKSYPAIHGKVFLRDDQLERTVTDFPDASKLLANQTKLDWQPHDLHGLLWQYLCNAPDRHGEVLRSIYAEVLNHPPSQVGDGWRLDDAAKREGKGQRTLFEILAGEWMGKDRRRGVPYSWAVGHLADARGQTSPRSFLAAIRAAAEDSGERYPEHEKPLHYESIKRGVQAASRIRVNEITEDHPWIQNVLAPLKGLTVPTDFEEVRDCWREDIGETPSGLTREGQLPPQHHESWEGIRDELARLGIFNLMSEDRINMPDLYRVGFGLGRRGGVKPVLR